MKIKDIKKQVILNIVDTRGNEYIRFGRDCWYRWIDNSLEEVYFTEDLEEEYNRTFQFDPFE